MHIVYVPEEAVVKKHQVLLDGRPGARVRRISRIHPIAEKRDKRAGYKFGRFSLVLRGSLALETRTSHHALRFRPENCKRPRLRPRRPCPSVKGL